MATWLITMKTPQSIVILTGAGISAESGIKTFRAADGLWENHRIEDVATPEAFVRNPEQVHRFYNQRRQQLLAGVKANAAHLALADFEKKLAANNTNFLLVTQNIDNLHELAGSQELVHIHGELLKIRCTHCQRLFSCDVDCSIDHVCQYCQHTGTLRPHVVWFGEFPLYMHKIQQALQHCDVFISIGTSGHVYPAAGFVQLAKQHGAKTIEINLAPSETASQFDQQFYGPATITVPAYLSQLLTVMNES